MKEERKSMIDECFFELPIVTLTIQAICAAIFDNIEFRRMGLKKQEIMGLGQAKKCSAKQKARSHFGGQSLEM